VIGLALLTVLAGEVDAGAVGRLVAAQKGHAVVLNFWATWCAPCVKEFPELIALAAQRKDVVFLSVSIDDKDSRGELEAFVTKHHPPFPVYAKAAGDDQAFIDGVDPEWSGVVPVTLVFDPAGKRVALLQGEHTRADIEKAVGIK